MTSCLVSKFHVENLERGKTTKKKIAVTAYLLESKVINDKSTKWKIALAKSQTNKNYIRKQSDL